MRMHHLTAANSILISVGIGLLLFYGTSQVRSAMGHQQGIEAFEAAKKDQQIKPRYFPADEHTGSRVKAARGDAASTDYFQQIDEPDKTNWSEKRISDYEKIVADSGLAELPEGILRIPSVGIELPVFAGTREANLTRGAGRIEGTPPLGTDGNTGIAAHRDGYFRALQDVRLGDDINIETIDGSQRFEVVELSIVNPGDTHVLEPTDHSAITLVTCYPFYFVGSAPQRYIVRAEKR
jgi:sortase A